MIASAGAPGNNSYGGAPIVSIARDTKEHIMLKQFLAQEEITLPL